MNDIMIQMTDKKRLFLRWLLKEDGDKESPLYGILWGNDYSNVLHFADLDSYGEDVGRDMNELIMELDKRHDGKITKNWKLHIKGLQQKHKQPNEDYGI